MSGLAKDSGSPASEPEAGPSTVANPGSATEDSPTWYDIDPFDRDMDDDEDPDYQDEPDEEDEDEDFFDVQEEDEDDDEGKTHFSGVEIGYQDHRLPPCR